MRLLFIIRNALIYTLFNELVVAITPRHSGLYSALNKESYGGAFLVGKWHLQDAKFILDGARFPEDIINRILWSGRSVNLHTRDYFDFFTEHLSAYSNIIGASFDTSLQKPLLSHVNSKLVNTSQILKNHSSSILSNQRGDRLMRTICMIPFSDKLANLAGLRDDLEQAHSSNRQNSFLATFYSVHRYFSNVAVYVATAREKELVLNWNLSLFDVIDMSPILAAVPPEKYFRNRPLSQLLPKYALLDIADRLRYDVKWQAFSYVYYTEGDQIMHMRRARQLYSAIDASNNTVAIVPHRMQVQVQCA
jgi:hypothetical protein